MTELLYLTDSYKKELVAHVLSVHQKGTQWEIVLDKTIFYPQGGGQPSDKGIINGASGTAHVKHVRLTADTVIHESTIEGSFKPGDQVQLSIDWPLRYYNMRVHSAGHIVHEAVKLVAPTLVPVKGEHGHTAYIEYEGSLTIDKKYAIEQHANEQVEKNTPLVTEFVSLEELTKRSPWVPAHLPANKPLRILTIGSFAPIPDGGTQVTHAGEVGPITITEIKNDDARVRVHYTVTQVETQVQEAVAVETPMSAAELTGLLLEAQRNATNVIAESDLPLDLLRLHVLGAKSEFAALTKQIKHIPTTDRQSVGVVINQVKQFIESAVAQKGDRGQKNDSDHELTDITMPGHIPLLGHLHPTTIVIREMNEIFQSMGFSVAEGPEIDTDEYNCDRVNLPLDHPARDLQDTLFIEDPTWLLRTHTSSVEAHILESEKPPYRFVVPGKVYRQEKANATNNIMFYQYQGLAIATDISMAHLRGTLDTFVRKFFGPARETRFRCKYYPEVEPGVGVDISCAFCNKQGCTVCKHRGWIEMLGAGMVHPNMLRRVNLDPAVYSGFAWGMGLDRIVMQRYGISDIRSLYNGDISYKE